MCDKNYSDIIDGLDELKEDIEIKEEDVSSPGATTTRRTKEETRAFHNQLERIRRNEIRDGFKRLKDVVPSLETGETETKPHTRKLILQKSAEFIAMMKNRNRAHEEDILSLRREIKSLEKKAREKEKSKKTVQGVISSGSKKRKRQNSESGNTGINLD